MIFNMTGGGAPLNFKVVPNPQPDTAKENTIWVDTDRINNYYFSATQPEGMVDYDVWFPVGTSSTVEFNALKKGGIQVYPLSAKQYVGGALVSKTAKSYQNGKWVDWMLLIYNNATSFENTDVLGGKGFYITANSPGRNGTLTKTADGISINSNSDANLTTVSHDSKVSFVGRTTLHVLWEGGDTSYDKNMQGIGIFDVNNTNYVSSAKAFLAKTQTGKYEATLDISNVSNGYIGLIGYDSTITFKQVWFT